MDKQLRSMAESQRILFWIGKFQTMVPETAFRMVKFARMGRKEPMLGKDCP